MAATTQDVQRNPDAADTPLVHPTLQSLAMSASSRQSRSSGLVAGSPRRAILGRATPRYRYAPTRGPLT